MVGEWVALPIIEAAGGKAPGDELFLQYQYPVAERLIELCDAVLRIPGASRGADLDVARARARGLPVYTKVDEIPRRAMPSSPTTPPPTRCWRSSWPRRRSTPTTCTTSWSSSSIPELPRSDGWPR
jgi:hypothetical protein